MSDPATDPLQIAIDGPAGTGKSSVAAALAERLGLVHVDTGAMYRALTLLGLREGLDPADGPGLARRLEGVEMDFRQGRLHLAGEDVAEAIRGEEVTARVSQVSAHAEVRRAMVPLQRRLCHAADGGAVLEGRDIGSVVLPLAPCKIYLDAGARERARRRLLQQGEAEDPVRLEEVRQEILRRDRLDSEREVSPLLISPDAHVLDTTDLDLEAVVARCAAWAEEETAPPPSAEELARLRGHDRFYTFVQDLVRRIVFRPCGLRIYGREHERVGGPLLYAANHISWFDPPLVGSTAFRQVHFLAKAELFQGAFGRLLRRLQAIPIVRGRWDPSAFEAATRVLRGDGSVVLFPEGTRKRPGRPGPAKRGLGALLQMAPAPFLPIYVRGTRSMGACLLRRERLEMWIGRARRLHALPVLERTISDAEIQQRVGRLWLACIEDLAQRSRRLHGGEGA